jgi:hypothetical protein
VAASEPPRASWSNGSLSAHAPELWIALLVRTQLVELPLSSVMICAEWNAGGSP